MNTKYKTDPVQEEMMKNTGSFTLTVIVEKDIEMTNTFKHIPNFIAFKTTLKRGDVVLSIGTGAGILNRLNKFLDRTVLFAKNASLIDAMVRSTKVLDALYLMPTNQKENEVDLEGRDKQVFYGDDDMPQYASQKQRAFLSQLLEKSNNSSKGEYLNHLNSPYLSRFDASEMISSLLPMK